MIISRAWPALFGLAVVCTASVVYADPCKGVPDRGPMPAYLDPGTMFSGPVVYIGDGDSLCVAIDPSSADWVEVRLADFYAPELADEGGERAKRVLTSITMRRRVECQADRRSHDRILARCTL